MVDIVVISYDVSHLIAGVASRTKLYRLALDSGKIMNQLTTQD